MLIDRLGVLVQLILYVASLPTDVGHVSKQPVDVLVTADPLDPDTQQHLGQLGELFLHTCLLQDLEPLQDFFLSLTDFLDFSVF